MFLSNDRFRDLLSSPPQPWLPGIFADIFHENQSFMHVNIPLTVPVSWILWEKHSSSPWKLASSGDFRLPLLGWEAYFQGWTASFWGEGKTHHPKNPVFLPYSSRIHGQKLKNPPESEEVVWGNSRILKGHNQWNLKDCYYRIHLNTLFFSFFPFFRTYLVSTHLKTCLFHFGHFPKLTKNAITTTYWDVRGT